MVRCQNPARAGPFGGCVPVQMAGAAGNATNTAGNAADTAATVGTSVGGSAATVTATAATPAATGTQLINSAKFRRVAVSQGHDIEDDDEEYDEELDEN